MADQNKIRNQISKREKEAFENRKRKTLRTLEFIIWVGGAMLIYGGFEFVKAKMALKLIYEYGYNMALYDIISIAVLVLLVFFPIIFDLIFGNLPIQSIREKLFKKTKNIEKEKLFAHYSSEELLETYAYDAKDLTDKLYKRSGVHLLVGSIIALIGIGFLTYQSGNFLNIVKDIDGGLSEYKLEFIMFVAQRLFAFLFIELVAFFFLRQYKVTMDEFRYYESVKRHIEANQILYQIIEERLQDNVLFEDVEDIKKLCSLYRFFDPIGKLGVNDSSEYLENRKIDKDILDKIIEGLSDLKSKITVKA